MDLDSLPPLAVTMGDAAGVGPEVIVGCWKNPRIHAVCRPFVIGHPEILRRADQLLKTGLRIVPVGSLSDLAGLGPESDLLPCLAVGEDNLLDVPPGTHDPRTGEGAYQAVCRAIELALSGEIAALVTAPLSKAALHAAGHLYPGHTELLAERCGVPKFAMMLYLPPGVANKAPGGLGVVHVTLHMALRDVFAHLTPETVLEKIELAHESMQQLGVARPRVGVAALNPHAGEDGLFGDEEVRIIAPAVAQAQQLGMDARGPLPSDTVMIAARDGEFDAVVAQYHDQGHIALKLLAMHEAVNVTLGLPIVRTSVAHGTAFDRAWQGTAETAGMVSAIETAARLARYRQLQS